MKNHKNKNWYKKVIAKIFPIDPKGEDINNGEFDPYLTIDRADRIFDKSRIFYDNDKNLSHVAIDNDYPIGALASGWSKDKGGTKNGKHTWVFSFDLAVDERFRNIGVGKALIENAIKKYEAEKASHTSEYETTIIRLHVVNAVLVNALMKIGFDVERVMSRYENGEIKEAFMTRK